MNIKRVGWISDSEFDQMKAAFVKGNNGLPPTEEMQLRIETFDRDIDTYVESEDFDHYKAEAVHILLQGRNFAARLLGLEQRSAPPKVVKMFRSIMCEPAPVAIYCHNPVVFRTIKQVLESLKEVMESLGKVSYVFYNDLNELITAVLLDDVRGIIAVNLDSHGRLESSIRHDLKNREGWDYARAEAAELPPIRDLQAGAQLLMQIIFTIQDMYELPAEQMRDPEMTADAFDLKAAIGEDIRKFRNMAKSPITTFVAVCDDNPDEVEGLLLILRAWPDLEVKFYDARDFTSATEMALMSSKHDIILVDEQMGLFTGRELVEQYQIMSTTPVIASISGGEVSWTNKHFPDKVRVMRNKVAALEFMHFMDHRIEEHLYQQNLLNK
jgi:hypothetical protein